MPIDPVGKGGGIPPQVPGASGANGPDAAAPTKTFEVGAAGSAQKTEGAQAVAANGPLEELRAGKIDVSQYVDRKVDEATSHLKGLHAAELAHIRETLRDKMVHDPQIADLVRQAAGSVPTPRDE